MIPKNVKHYRQLCAALHDFHAGRFWSADYVAPSRATLFDPANSGYLARYAGERYGLGNTGLMDYWLNRHFPLLAEDFGSRVPRPVFPLVRNVVTSKAAAFREQVTVSLVDGTTGRTLTPDEAPLVRTLDRRLRESGWYAAMRAKEELAVLYGTAASWYRIADGELVITALSPMALDITPWEAAPSDTARALSIAVPIGGDSYTPDPDKELRAYYERIPGTPATWRAAIVDPDGLPVAELPEAPGGELMTGMYPVVVWHEGVAQGPYAAPPLSLYYAQVDVLLELIAATVAVRLGGHGTIALSRSGNGDPLATAGQDIYRDVEATAGEPVRFPGGVQAVFQSPDGWTPQVLQNRVDPEAYAKWVQAKIKLAYIAEDMAPGSVDLINPPPSNVSGRARLAEQMPRILAKSRRESQLREQAQADLRVWASYWNMVAPESEQVPEGAAFRVQFDELWSSDALTDQSVVQALQGSASVGLADLIRVRQQIDQSTYEEASQAWWSTMGRYKAGVQNTAPAPRESGGNEPPA